MKTTLHSHRFVPLMTPALSQTSFSGAHTSRFEAKSEKGIQYWLALTPNFHSAKNLWNILVLKSDMLFQRNQDLLYSIHRVCNKTFRKINSRETIRLQNKVYTKTNIFLYLTPGHTEQVRVNKVNSCNLWNCRYPTPDRENHIKAAVSNSSI